jgi:hypothetical protein
MRSHAHYALCAHKVGLFLSSFAESGVQVRQFWSGHEPGLLLHRCILLVPYTLRFCRTRGLIQKITGNEVYHT